jgi:hypothetical protein
MGFGHAKNVGAKWKMNANLKNGKRARQKMWVPTEK